MALPSSVFTEMVTTTHRRHSTMVSDNVSEHNALYRRLKQRGRMKKVTDGGYEIVEPLAYQENSTYQRYSGYDVLNVQASDVLSAAKYEWVQAAVHVTASGRELALNNGRDKMIDLVDARLQVARDTAANNMSVDLYSSGSLSNQMGGLAHIIQTNGQGTVGGIDSSTQTWWRNQFKEITGTDAWTSATLPGYMKDLWLTLVRGADKPDMIVSTHDFFSAYWDSRNDLMRYSSSDGSADTIQSLKFQGVDLMFDSNDNFSTTGERMYFINTKYMKLHVHSDADWTPLPKKESANQHAVIIPMIWMGQLVCSNRARQGILIDAS